MKAPTIDPRFRDYLRTLDATEYGQLEADIVANGCREALVVWAGHDVLIDGHHRLRICTEHGLPYHIHEVELADEEAVIQWIIRNQLGRRNIGPDEFAYLIGKLYESAKRQGSRTDLTSRHNGGKLPGVRIARSRYASTWRATCRPTSYRRNLEGSECHGERAAPRQ